MSDSQKSMKNLSNYDALCEKLKQELSQNPPDEGDVFGILDIFLFFIETEEKFSLGNIAQDFTSSLLKSLSNIDNFLGRGLFRIIKLCLYAPKFLSKLIEVSREIDDKLKQCPSRAITAKKFRIVHFVENGGGNFKTPVIQKWLRSRSFKFSQQEWDDIVAKLTE